LLWANLAHGQNKTTFFVGLQPSVTKEKFYEKKEFDLNIIPIVFQIPIAKRADLRIVSLCNYHFDEEVQIADLGLNFALPVYLKQKEETKSPSSGWYLSPILGLGRNLLNKHNTATLAVEPGYFFKTNGPFAFSCAVQYGRTYFQYDEAPDLWRSHFGVKINLGLWL